MTVVLFFMVQESIKHFPIPLRKSLKVISPRGNFLEKIYRFYRYDCCWPYAVSFFLALLIYGLDFFMVHAHYHWASLASYTIILAYYLYIAYLYFQGKVKKENDKFSMVFLTSKVILLGCILILLYFLEYQI